MPQSPLELHEQDNSLAEALLGAGVQHGDTVRAVMDVGVYSHGPRSMLCFCATEIGSVSPIAAGSPEERAKPMPMNVRLSNGSRRTFRDLHGFHGFARVSCNIHTNGRISVRGLEILDITEAPPTTTVDEPGSFSDFIRQEAESTSAMMG